MAPNQFKFSELKNGFYFAFDEVGRISGGAVGPGLAKKLYDTEIYPEFLQNLQDSGGIKVEEYFKEEIRKGNLSPELVARHEVYTPMMKGDHKEIFTGLPAVISFPAPLNGISQKGIGYSSIDVESGFSTEIFEEENPLAYLPFNIKDERESSLLIIDLFENWINEVDKYRR